MQLNEHRTVHYIQQHPNDCHGSQAASISFLQSGNHLQCSLTTHKRYCFCSSSQVCRRLYPSISATPRSAASFMTRIDFTIFPHCNNSHYYSNHQSQWKRMLGLYQECGKTSLCLMRQIDPGCVVEHLLRRWLFASLFTWNHPLAELPPSCTLCLKMYLYQRM